MSDHARTEDPSDETAAGPRPKRRVGMVLTTMGFGGVPEVVFQLMRHLPRDRYATSLCVLKRETDADNVCDERRDRFAELGFDVHYAAESSRKLETVASVAQWIEDRALDVLHTHSNRPNVIGRMAGTLCRSSGLRIVAHYHNQYDDKWERDPAMLAFERRLAHTTDAMIAVSESVRQHVAANIGVPSSRLEVIGNGVDASAFASGDRVSARAALSIDDEVLLVGLVGRITEQKGQEDFVAAALRLCAVRRDVQFWMVGFAEDHALHERLVRVVADAGMTARIR
ncbi:MAG: glycosyltransferase, partial [Planctomycetota bacterium]